MAIYKDKNKTKDGRQWYFKAYKGKIAYKSKRYLTKAEALENEARFIMNRDNPSKKNFHLVALEYFDNVSVKSSTLKSYKTEYNKHIRDFFINSDIDVTNQLYKEWYDLIDNSTLSLSMKNKLYSLMKSIFDYAIKVYDLKRNVAKNFGTFKEVNDKPIKEQKLQYITFEEFQKFISVIDDPLWHCFFTTLFYTGCRKSELFALTWNDITDTTITINKSISRGIDGEFISSTKTNKSRVIKMNRNLKEELVKYKQVVQQYTDFNNNWFVFGDGFIPMARSTADRYKHYYFELSGVIEITMHQFRHSCISCLVAEYIKSTPNIDTTKFFLMLSDRMGHSVDVLQRTYLHLFPNTQDEIVDLLDNL